MYVEVFLIDNALMDLIAVRLAAALLSVRPPLARQAAFAALSAAAAAAAVYLVPQGVRVLLFPLLLPLLALALPVKSPKGLLRACAAVAAATLMTGGCALSAALIMGGGGAHGAIRGSVPLRVFLVFAAAASFLPGAVMRLKRAGGEAGLRTEFTVEAGGLEWSFTAIVDTGNRLKDPWLKLPVAVVTCRGLERLARIPVPVVTPAGSTVLYALRPDRAAVNGTPVGCLVAVSKQALPAGAILPPELIPPPL
ncbi:MAG: sigma-E processing peptidase SpoIIGA [Clostridia bacterium]|nr:sigma-E processing peptidase SpoIIGA [Clostridia bacterium]MBQ2517393.1 sigma-E processing peptidase SpoIIGA [Clostridia bacterium]MBR6428454.1 sigma-E processing peptidase SpoIIGA [Clostridia bacterium]